MATQVLDCLGMKCPQPTLKVSILATKMKPGDILEVVADCSTFENDVREWCNRSKKTLLWVKDEGAGKKRVQIKF
ncbi:sulfurtransferase TusA family protein [Geobacter sp. FeAm09]|uniref:sulfurtransferase TusA family protein n=1 Tax=Geobacter sp. FeAm09 TaxID=2597769 RepID=UPI0011EC0DDD|nr:sulfurtransferase TusA family protein [Geobacter sp. FeAm09]QEM66916.1 sulfurtransferase TusA family protein [Geobacter sp. FeAm09]